VIEGGVGHIAYSYPQFDRCIMRNNESRSGAGALYILGNHNDDANFMAEIRNCLIYDNSASNGGAFHTISSQWRMENCTITGNIAKHGGGIYNNDGSSPLIKNCIFWGNFATVSESGEIYNLFDSADPNFSYCDIEGGLNDSKCYGPNSIDGGGNIDCDPCFVDDSNSDYHIKSVSCCVGSGDPCSSYSGQYDIDDEPRLLGSIVDIGADEVGPPCWFYPTQCHADADGSGHVNSTDFGIVKYALYTSYGDPNYNPCGDFDRDGYVDDDDVDILIEYYLTYPDANCTAGGVWPPEL
jgi:hypothetical protein